MGAIALSCPSNNKYGGRLVECMLRIETTVFIICLCRDENVKQQNFAECSGCFYSKLLLPPDVWSAQLCLHLAPACYGLVPVHHVIGRAVITFLIKGSVKWLTSNKNSSVVFKPIKTGSLSFAGWRQTLHTIHISGRLFPWSRAICVLSCVELWLTSIRRVHKMHFDALAFGRMHFKLMFDQTFVPPLLLLGGKHNNHKTESTGVGGGSSGEQEHPQKFWIGENPGRMP